ncbi:MAG: molybdopterin-dependent oxidoreductase, partial [Chloroflexota bacterium]|nr:molybdopterin-dependent oxidoreductase [Chloroflexota bacterium]
SWDEALGVVASELARYSGDAFGGVAGPHCTNEENYLFGKLVRGVMETNNLDHDAGNGRGVRRAGLREVLGSDAATNGFLDSFENSRVVLVIGSNLSATHPVFSYKLQMAARRMGIKLIIACPKAVPLTQIADCAITYQPGTEALLLNGLAAIVARRGLAAEAYVREHVANHDEWAAVARRYTPEGVSAVTGVPAEVLEAAATLYATGGAGEAGRGDDGLYPPSAIVYSAGLTLREGGEAIDYGAAALALLTGNVGRPGAGVNRLKVANNSQGAVDMGCAPFLLPGEAAVEDDAAGARLQQAWGMRRPPSATPGLGLEQMLQAAERGELRAMYIMGSNPVGAAPDPDLAARALSRLEFLVVQDMFRTPTAELAHVVLPACSWAEKDGTYTSAERRIQRVNKALKTQGQSLPDWTVLVQVMVRMGYELPYRRSEDILQEITQVVPAYAGVTRERLENPRTVVTMRPGKVYRNPSIDQKPRMGLQWPVVDGEDTPVLYADGFPHGQARLVPVPFEAGAGLGDGVYGSTLEISLYKQGTDTMTGRCPTLVSLHENNAADSSLERGRGVGMLQGPNLKLSGYSTGQLTDI